MKKHAALVLLLALGMGLVSCEDTASSSSQASSSETSTSESTSTSTSTSSSESSVSSESSSSAVSSETESSVSSGSSSVSSESSSSVSSETSSSSSSSSSSEEEKQYVPVAVVAPHFTASAFAPADGSSISNPVKGTAVDLSNLEVGTTVLVYLEEEEATAGQYELRFDNVSEGVANVMFGALPVQVNVAQRVLMFTVPDTGTTLDLTSYVFEAAVTYSLEIKLGGHMLAKIYERDPSTGWSNAAPIGEELDPSKIEEGTNVVIMLEDNPDDEGVYVLTATEDVTIGDYQLRLNNSRTAFSLDNIQEDISLDLTGAIGLKQAYLGTHSVFDHDTKTYVDLVLNQDGSGTYNGYDFDYSVSSNENGFIVISIPYDSSNDIINGNVYFNDQGYVYAALYVKVDGDYDYFYALGIQGETLTSMENIIVDSFDTYLGSYTVSGSEESKNILVYSGDVFIDDVLVETIPFGEDYTYYYISKEGQDYIFEDYPRLVGRVNRYAETIQRPDMSEEGTYTVTGEDKTMYIDGYELAKLDDEYYSYRIIGDELTLTSADESTVLYFSVDKENKSVTKYNYLEEDPFISTPSSYENAESGIILHFDNGKVTVEDTKGTIEDVVSISVDPSLKCNYTFAKNTYSFTLELEDYYDTISLSFDLEISTEEGYPTLTLSAELAYEDWWNDIYEQILPEGTVFSKVVDSAQ